MNKKAPSRVTVVKPPLRTTQDERTRAHRTINWVVSVILVGFAIWSIQLNAQGRGMLKQSTAVVESIDTKIESLTKSMQEVKDVCTQPPQTPIVVPVETTDTQKKQ